LPSSLQKIYLLPPPNIAFTQLRGSPLSPQAHMPIRLKLGTVLLGENSVLGNHAYLHTYNAIMRWMQIKK